MNDVANVIAILTAYSQDGAAGAAVIILSLTPEERGWALACAIGMLMRELQLGCADAGIELGEYLQLAGLAAANGAVL